MIINPVNTTYNFVNESHLLVWGKLQLGLVRQTEREPSIHLYIHAKNLKFGVRELSIV